MHNTRPWKKSSGRNYWPCKKLRPPTWLWSTRACNRNILGYTTIYRTCPGNTAAQWQPRLPDMEITDKDDTSTIGTIGKSYGSGSRPSDPLTGSVSRNSPDHAGPRPNIGAQIAATKAQIHQLPSFNQTNPKHDSGDCNRISGCHTQDMVDSWSW